MFNGKSQKMFIEVIVFLSVTANSICQDFGYTGEKGPNHWGEQYESCTGKYQSPINIQTLEVESVSLPPLILHGFDLKPNKLNVKNNGHTVMIRIDSPDPIQIEGGPLIGLYEFLQLHFHWGEDDTVGSEDLLDGRSFPMELHVVFSKKSTKKSNVEIPDDLAVLAFFFEIQEDDNPYYGGIVELLSNVIEYHSETDLLDSPPLRDLTPIDLAHYYTYNGSLTTPPCSEVVTWIDFENPIPLSSSQIEKFRQIQDNDGQQLTHNFRPIQPIGDRIVWYNNYDIDENDLRNAPASPEKADDKKTIDEVDDGNDIEIPSDIQHDVNNDLENIMNDEPDSGSHSSKTSNSKKSDNGSTHLNVNCSLFILLLLCLIVRC